MDLSATAPSLSAAATADVACYNDDYPLLFGEPAGAARLALIGLVLAGIVGLKVVEG